MGVTLTAVILITNSAACTHRDNSSRGSNRLQYRREPSQQLIYLLLTQRWGKHPVTLWAAAGWEWKPQVFRSRSQCCPRTHEYSWSTARKPASRQEPATVKGGDPTDARLSDIRAAAAPGRPRWALKRAGYPHQRPGTTPLSEENQLPSFSTRWKMVKRSVCKTRVAWPFRATIPTLGRATLAIRMASALGLVTDPISATREGPSPVRARTVPETGGASAIPCRNTWGEPCSPASAVTRSRALDFRRRENIRIRAPGGRPQSLRGLWRLCGASWRQIDAPGVRLKEETSGCGWLGPGRVGVLGFA